MSGSSNRFLRDERGASLVELALLFPVVLLVGALTVELGHALYQEVLMERGLKAAGLYGARNDWPLTAPVEAKMSDLAKRGSTDPAAPLLVPGWADTGATLTIEYRAHQVGNDSLPVIRLTATVPYRSLIPGAATMLGLGSITISAAHEQPLIGQ